MKYVKRIFYPWTKWQDVTLFGYGSEQYLLQGREHLWSGRKQFAVRAMGQWWRTAKPHPGEVKPENIQFTKP
jgi:hypothetical protein